MHCKPSCGLQLENDHAHLLLTWLCHTLPHSHRIFPLPFLQLLLHLVNLGRVQSPQTAFPRRVAWFVFNFLKAFVQGQVVAHGVLPAIRGCLETQSQSKNGFSRKKKQSILYIMKLEKKNQNQNRRKVILMPKWTYCVPYNWNMGFYTWLLHFFCFTLIFKPVVEAGGSLNLTVHWSDSSMCIFWFLLKQNSILTLRTVLQEGKRNCLSHWDAAYERAGPYHRIPMVNSWWVTSLSSTEIPYNHRIL